MYVHHIAITVKDLPESLRIYTEAFGFRQVLQFTRGLANVVHLRLNDFQLELYELPSVKEGTGLESMDVVGIKHLAFAVSNLEEAISNAKKHNLLFSEPQLGKSGNRYSMGVDCNGIALELLEVVEAEGNVKWT